MPLASPDFLPLAIGITCSEGAEKGGFTFTARLSIQQHGVPIMRLNNTNRRYLCQERGLGRSAARRLEALTAEAAGELDVLWHDRHPAAVDGAEAGVGEEVHEVGLGRLLHREHGARLESEAVLAGHRDLSHDALEGQLAEEEVGAALVAADVTEGDGAWAEAEGLLHVRGAAGLGRRLAGGGLLPLRHEHLAWELAGGFA